MSKNLMVGAALPDFQLPDHTGAMRRLAELQGDNVMVLLLGRGEHCPRERQHQYEMAKFYEWCAVAGHGRPPAAPAPRAWPSGRPGAGACSAAPARLWSPARAARSRFPAGGGRWRGRGHSSARLRRHTRWADRPRGQDHGRSAGACPPPARNAVPAVGAGVVGSVPADHGCRDQVRQTRLAARPGVLVITPPRKRLATRSQPQLLHAGQRLRTGVATVGAPVTDRCARAQMRVHDRWHAQQRRSRKVLAHPSGVLLNLQLGRPPLDLAGLVTA